MTTSPKENPSCTERIFIVCILFIRTAYHRSESSRDSSLHRGGGLRHIDRKILSCTSEPGWSPCLTRDFIRSPSRAWLRLCSRIAETTVGDAGFSDEDGGRTCLIRKQCPDADRCDRPSLSPDALPCFGSSQLHVPDCPGDP